MSSIKRLAGGVLDLVPLAFYRAIIRRDVIGIFYHLVTDQPVPHVRHLYPARQRRLFEEDLIYLRDHFHPISYAELLACLRRGAQVPANAVFLSFDDGFMECFTVVKPLLEQYQIPCTFFIATDFVDNHRMYYRNKASLCLDRFLSQNDTEFGVTLESVNDNFHLSLKDRSSLIGWVKSITDEKVLDRLCEVLEVDIRTYLETYRPYLSSDQIRALAQAGFTIGAHSRKHSKLNRLTEPEIEAEIIGSCEIIKTMTGSDSVPFSFPNSGAGLDRRFLERLRADHPWIGLLFDTKSLQKDEDFIFNRIWVESPVFNPGGKSSLSEILKRVYQNHALNP